MNKIVKISVQTITPKEVDQIRQFLLDQPKYRTVKEDELGENTNRYSVPGVEQHYLWQQENQAHSWQDFEMWPTTKSDREHLIMPGELFLCDLVGGELWIGRMPSGEGKPELVAQVSSYMFGDYNNNFNGYAVLPKTKEDE